jgi:hypothetical protein
MSKLYIPTTSLNFNNIFSSESISPAGFYSRRNFGYHTFSKVVLNNFENSILLYSKFPVFSIPPSDYDDYPMVIEFEKEDFLDELKPVREIDGVLIFQCHKTIYLNPFTTRIYFIDKNHKRIALSKAEASAETKLIKLYQQRLDIFSKQIESFDNLDCIKGISDLTYLAQQEIENDKIKDRIKGFAYSYIIGSNKSLRKDLVSLKKQSRMIFNIVSSILNSVDGKATLVQTQQLDKAIMYFNRLQCGELVNEINNIGETNKGNDILNFFISRFKINLPVAFDANHIRYSLTDKDKSNIAIQQMSTFVDEVEMKYLQTKPLFIWQDNIAITSSKLTVLMDLTINEISRPIYQSLINDVFTSEDFSGKTFSPRRFDLITNVLYSVKRNIEANGEKWEDHPARECLNNLRKNVGGDNVSFHIKWDSGVLSAIAAFILKGDDPDKLEDFLIENEIVDYRLAFGFYGALFGFAELSKVFTNNLFNIKDLSYLSEVYKIVFKQLHNVELMGDLIHHEEVSYPKSYAKAVPSTKNSSDQKNISIKSYSEEIFAELKKFDPKVDPSKQEYIELILKYGISEKLIKAIDGSKLKQKTKAIKFFKEKMEKTTIGKETRKENVIQGNLTFSSDTKVYFFSDVNAWEYIKIFIPKESINIFKNDLEWFQNEWKDAQSKYYSVSSFPRTNEDAINAYKGFLNKKDNNGMYKRNYSANISVDKIINKLREKYK